MSLVKTNRITNLEDNGQVEAIQGLKISSGKKLTISGALEAGNTGNGISGQYLQSTATGVRWAGLPQDISSTADVTFRNITSSQNVIIEGSLQVNGTSIGLSNLGIGSNEITLNNDVIGSPTDDANIIVNRGDQPDTLLRWSEAQQRWQFTNDGSTYYNILLPTETDFGVAEQFGSSGDGNVYNIQTASLQTAGSNTYLKVTLETRANIAKFRSNHQIKIFGASTTAISALPTAPVAGSQSVSASFEPSLFNDGETPHSFYAYAFAHFRLSSGDISNYSVYPTVVENVSSGEMNEGNYNVLNLTRNSGNGMLVYRAEFTGQDAQANAQAAVANIATNQTPFKLIAVLGTKEFTSDTLNANWQDYGQYDVTDWSLRSDSGEYLNTTIHFPLNPPTQVLRGWATSGILNINGSEGSFWINLPNLRAGAGPIQVVHDDTVALQNSIDAAAAGGKNFLIIPGGTYLVDTIKVPNGFTFRGLADATVFKKQYWNTTSLTTASRAGLRNTMIISKTYDFTAAFNTWGLINSTIGDIVFDGNAANQILYDFSDLGTETNNSLVGLPNSRFVKLQNVKIRNSSGPALFAEGSTNFSIESCNFIDGCETERYNTDCLLMSDCENTKINASIFQNYPGPLDLTTSQVVSMSGCVVRNCGSGVRIYGSINTDVGKNLVLGPADEYIGVPDLFDSDFDSVNITVRYGVDTETPVYQYVENGRGKDLTDIILRFNVYPVAVTNNQEVVSFNTPVTTQNGNDIFTYVNPTDENLDPVDNIELGQIRFRMPSANSTLISAATPNSYNVYQITGIEYKPIGDDLNSVLGTGTFSTNQYTLNIVNPPAFAAVAVDDYVKLIAHSYSPSSAVDVWKVVSKTAGAQNQLVLSPYIQNPNGDLNPTTISGVGVTPTFGGGYMELRERFLIAKGVVNISS